MKNIMLIALLAFAAWYGYEQFQRRALVSVTGEANSTAPAPLESRLKSAPTPPENVFKCDGRIYCSQMTSCAEATYFLRNCPGTKMDGDRDGVPCESQWCGH